MRWQDLRRSDNVDDRRDEDGGGSGGGLPIGQLGIGGVVIVGIISLLLGQNPLQVLGLIANHSAPAHRSQPAQPKAAARDDSASQFARAILASTEDVWSKAYPEAFGNAYKKPTLVLFRGQVKSACGSASSAMGPFYCSADQQVYIDLSFYDELAKRYGAPGDFANAYVLAHEIGHHVQNLSGISGKVHQKQQQVSKKQANALSVKLELQADCLAGVWGYYAAQNKLLEPGDVEAGLAAANAIGDDTLQRGAGQAVTPDAFTHGSSEQRMHWFKQGLTSGSVSSCNTFANK
ncbi:neutral zinc metallopeptidase [Iodobacter sp. CM08]|uniref:KPN_02809 family neutral zinc metallopeptidase n=1 Tax=Iodobacter sp. CM08 TaxID=3085902 RepID=UPI0029815E49|nr:neutral zinc metallopeptidase [Iodobacter sp. CM08]MDW5418039.1 neutral zinc metallopeptidase [Iodobacter sp. CM08]